MMVDTKSFETDTCKNNTLQKGFGDAVGVI